MQLTFSCRVCGTRYLASDFIGRTTGYMDEVLLRHRQCRADPDALPSAIALSVGGGKGDTFELSFSSCREATVRLPPLNLEPDVALSFTLLGPCPVVLVVPRLRTAEWSLLPAADTFLRAMLCLEYRSLTVCVDAIIHLPPNLASNWAEASVLHSRAIELKAVRLHSSRRDISTPDPSEAAHLDVGRTPDGTAPRTEATTCVGSGVEGDPAVRLEGHEASTCLELDGLDLMPQRMQRSVAGGWLRSRAARPDVRCWHGALLDSESCTWLIADALELVRRRSSRDASLRG